MIQLYNKYRPLNFSNVIGQDFTKKILINSIEKNKIIQTMFFLGPRGSGKTSTARIYAAAVNCSNLINGNSCTKCSSCVSILKHNQHIDLIEMDAASKSGKEDIEKIIENSKIRPMTMKYKVFIIDEIHMLSQAAFNSLLKVLEEPPSYLIFILASTEIHKIPETILSRCMIFEFTEISGKDAFARIKSITEKENIEIEDHLLKLIISFSDGDMRKTISNIEKLSLVESKIDENIISNLFSIPKVEEILKILTETNNKNKVKLVMDAFNAKVNMKNSLRLFFDIVYQIKINKYISKDSTKESLLSRFDDSLLDNIEIEKELLPFIMSLLNDESFSREALISFYLNEI